MEKETVLEVEFMQVWDRWAWRVKNHNLETGRHYYDKECTDNIFVDEYNNVYFCQADNDGWLESMTNDRYLLSIEKKAKLEKVVREVNEKYGKPKRWRAKEEERYVYIGSDGLLWLGREIGSTYDDYLYDLGNYFQTKEQAEKALERMKKALREDEE